MAWTGSFMSRRELLGIKLRWSYAPAEVKVLKSADGGNFEEASRWRRTARTEPSFEETIMFATPVSVKAVKVLMRGAKPSENCVPMTPSKQRICFQFNRKRCNHQDAAQCSRGLHVCWRDKCHGKHPGDDCKA